MHNAFNGASITGINMPSSVYIPIQKVKFISLGSFHVGLIGGRGRKNNKLPYKSCLWQLGTGVVLYFFCAVIW